MHNNWTDSGSTGYFEEFVSFWSARPEVKKIWFSLFTPQLKARSEEILLPLAKQNLLSELIDLRRVYPKIYLPKLVVKGYLNSPKSPDECIVARTTLNSTAGLKNKVVPCQFGGAPDCSHCGCMAPAGLAAVGDYRLLGFVPVSSIYNLSDKIEKTVQIVTNKFIDKADYQHL